MKMLTDACDGDLLSSTVLHLEDHRICMLNHLELLSGTLKTLFLQDNLLSSLAGMEFLTKLSYLNVNGNNLLSIEPLAALKELRYLDAGKNSLSEVQGGGVSALPASLRILRLEGNPMCEKLSYRSDVLSSLPQIVDLDFVPVAGKGRGEVAAERNGEESCARVSLRELAGGAIFRSKERRLAAAMEETPTSNNQNKQ